jgi:hypothetical protein
MVAFNSLVTQPIKAHISKLLDVMLSGLSGPSTITIYRLGINGLPLEPLADIVPTITLNRQSLDVVIQSQHVRTYDVTTNPRQGGVQTTSNSHRNLDTLSVQGVISAAPQLAIAAIASTLSGAGGRRPGATVVPGLGAIRRDLAQLSMLYRLADLQEPVMVVTPDLCMPKACFTQIARINSPDVGEATEVQLAFVEAQIISPEFADALMDLEELLTGNDSVSDQGSQGTDSVELNQGILDAEFATL